MNGSARETASVLLRRDEQLPADLVSQVERLVERAAEHDGVPPLSEDAVLALRRPGRAHLLLTEGDQTVGYAGVPTAGGPAELTVDPPARGRGLGRRLAVAVVEDTGETAQVWAHGNFPAAARLARALGFAPVRELRQLRRPLTDADDGPGPLPPGVRLRPFEPGRDDQVWLALNSTAFAGHPEQGRWTAEDLAVRVGAPGFDPAGFLVAERDGALVGFHWTKVHPATTTQRAAGEVYVLGVHPSTQGTGLGGVLLRAGLAHLRRLGLDEVLLYVEATNRPALTLYERQGFRAAGVDVLYARAALAGRGVSC